MTILPPTLNRMLEVEEAAQAFCKTANSEKLNPFGKGDSTAGMEFELQVSVPISTAITKTFN